MCDSSSTKREALYIIVEHTPDGPLPLVVYDSEELARTRLVDIARCKLNEHAAAIEPNAEEVTVPTVTVEFELSEPEEATELPICCEIIKNTTTVYPATWLSSEQKTEKTEVVETLRLLPGCSRYRLQQLRRHQAAYLQDIEDAVAGYDEERQILRESLRKLRLERDSLEFELEQYRAVNNANRSLIERARTRELGATAELQQLRSELLEVKKKFAAAEKRHAKHAAKLAERREQTAELLEREKMRADISSQTSLSLSAEMAEANRKLHRDKEERKVLRRKLRAAEERISVLEATHGHSSSSAERVSSKSSQEQSGVITVQMAPALLQELQERIAMRRASIAGSQIDFE